MYTYSAKPNTIEEVQTTIENWLGSRYKEAKRPCTLSRKPDEPGLNVFISHSAHYDLKVEMIERILLFEVKHTRLNLDLEKFQVWSAYKGKNLCLSIKSDTEPEHRSLVMVLKEFNKTKHPAFCARILRAVKDLETDLTTSLIDEVTAAPTDQLVMLEAVSSAPWVS